MKKLFIIALLCAALPAIAQRHEPGTTGLELDAGFLDHFKTKNVDNAGYFGSLYLSNYTENGNYWKYGYTQTIRYFTPVSTHTLVNVQQYVGDLSYFKPVLSNRGSDFYINIGAGGSLGYERVNEGNAFVEPGAFLVQKSKTIFGGFVGTDLEFYLSDHFILLAKAAERWYPTSTVTHFNFNAGIGIKFIIITH